MSEPETACIPNWLLKLVQCQSAGRRKPDKRAALLVKSPCVAVGMLQVFDVAILIRPVRFPRPPSESAMIAIQGHNRREIALYSPDLVGQHPKEAIAESWAVAFEKKANDFAGWALDMLDHLGFETRELGGAGRRMLRRRSICTNGRTYCAITPSASNHW